MAYTEDKNGKRVEMSAQPAQATAAVQPQVQTEKTLTPEEIAKEKAAAHMSKGEKWYNRIVYSGLNYWVNLGLSLYITDIFVHGGGKLDPSHGGFKRFFDSGVKKVANWLNHGKFNEKTANRANRAAEVILSTFTLNTGGNVLLLPMKWLEDRKRPVVHWINKHIFKDKQLASDGHEKTPDEIYIEQEQPKQSWGRVIARRLLAISSTIATGLVADWALRRKLTPDELETAKPGETHLDGTKRFTNWITNGVDYVVNRVTGKKLTDGGTTKRYVGYAALDTIYTWMTATVMHRTNGAGKFKMPKEIGDDFDPPGMAATDEIKPLPVQTLTHAEAAKTAMATALSPEEKLSNYKNNTVFAPAEKHTDLAKASEPNYSIAP